MGNTAIPALTVSATDSSATATIITWSATGLPTGLAIANTGTITGTSTSAGTYPVTLTATDSAGYSGSASFTWTVTNPVSVSLPGRQSNVSGAAITAVQVLATDSSGATITTWAATGLPTGLAIARTAGQYRARPPAPAIYSVTLTATDSQGFSGAASFTWAITNSVSVTNPGAQADVSGSPISPLQGAASDAGTGASFTWAATGLPAGLSVNAASGAIPARLLRPALTR